jgi:hypothetical protein
MIKGANVKALEEKPLQNAGLTDPLSPQLREGPLPLTLLYYPCLPLRRGLKIRPFHSLAQHDGSRC